MVNSLTLGNEIRLQTGFGLFKCRYATSGAHEAIVVQADAAARPPVLVRIQSSCVFSESLGALDCDCADQLHTALAAVSVEGGCVVYTFEEGRGAGLRHKFDAVGYQQHENVDTVEAFRALGLPPDLRDYELASAVIRAVYPGDRIALLTNNPGKVAAVSARGVKVVERRPLVVARRREVSAYLSEKSRVLGHVLDES